MLLRVDRETYTARVVDGALETLERGDAAAADAVLTGTPAALHSAAGGSSPEEVGLIVDGDRGAAERFLASVGDPRRH